MRNRFIIIFVFVILALGWLLMPAAQIFVNPPTAASQSFGEQLWQGFYAATNGKSETEFNNISGPNVTWNTNGILYGLKGFTGFSDLNYVRSYGTEIPATALTPRHIYVRGHDNGATNAAVDPANFIGKYYIFLTASNQVVTARVKAAFKRIGTFNGVYQDYCILLLSNALPADIQCVKMADPTAFAAKLALEPSVFWWPRTDPQLGTCTHNIVGTVPTTASGHSMFISGDSGSPNFYVLKGEIIMLSGRTTSGYSAQMQADVDALSAWEGLNPADYKIQLLDLSQL